mmetsp:Transcript_17947/g.31186  ORF Transcript_17947/g.31186 Transcript_17947/m.31186 type:complete len:228 (+) Transcript_17947:82-765(+)
MDMFLHRHLCGDLHVHQAPHTNLLHQHRRVARLVALLHGPIGGKAHTTSGADLQAVDGPDGASGDRSSREEILNGHTVTGGQDQRERHVHNASQVISGLERRKLGQNLFHLFLFGSLGAGNLSRGATAHLTGTRRGSSGSNSRCGGGFHRRQRRHRNRSHRGRCTGRSRRSSHIELLRVLDHLLETEGLHIGVGIVGVEDSSGLRAWHSRGARAQREPRLLVLCLGQ